MQHILVVGAGSVGGFFGAHLAQHHQASHFAPQTHLGSRSAAWTDYLKRERNPYRSSAGGHTTFSNCPSPILLCWR